MREISEEIGVKTSAHCVFKLLTVLHVDFLDERRTINADYYCQVLDAIGFAYRQKRLSCRIREVLLLHNNTRSHTTADTLKKLRDIPLVVFID